MNYVIKYGIIALLLLSTGVQAESIHASAAALTEKARIALSEELKTQYQRLELKAVHQARDSDAELDSFTVDMTLSYPIARRVCVWLDNGEQRIPVWFEVQAWDRVLVAQTRTGADIAIAKDSFVWAERNIAGLKGKPAKQLSDKNWLISSLQSGDILLARQIKAPPQIVAGQSVRVHLQQNRVNLVMDTVALTSGYSGQRINVKNPANQKTLLVQITGSGQAELLS